VDSAQWPKDLRKSMTSKGLWDAAGKVIKQYMRQQEPTKKYCFANAFDCF
jgi:hypothetical protein